MTEAREAADAGRRAEAEDNAAIRGMVNQVQHLVRVEEVAGEES